MGDDCALGFAVYDLLIICLDLICCLIGCLLSCFVGGGLLVSCVRLTAVCGVCDSAVCLLLM